MQPQSMTGYGRGSSGNFRVDIRSSNHKNIDININVPNYLFSYDLEIRKRVKKTFKRGRIEIYIPRQEMENIKMKVNKALAIEYYKALNAIKDDLSISEDVGINVLAAQRDIFMLDEPEINDAALYDALDIALAELKKTRIEEADNLLDDINKRITMSSNYINNIEEKRNETISDAKEKLHERLKEFLGEALLDETRLVQEVAVLVEKTDITEEIVRIKSHLKHFEDVLKSGEVIGKKLDFIIQELRREVNTIGSKSQDIEISTSVVEMKHELEKIKEQIQNLQ
jgi:uncharacterized protein (TIGR00255 family)